MVDGPVGGPGQRPAHRGPGAGPALYELQANGALSSQQALRPGVGPVTVPLASSDDTVATPESALTFQPGTWSASTRMALLAPGTATISMTQPAGFDQPTNGRLSLVATVT